MATVTNNSATTSSNAALANLYGASSATGTTSAEKSASASEQSDKFLQLLVAQMKNQDPLNPLDNAQVTSQMAQISTVEGIEKLNSTMGKFADSSSAKAADMSNLIGQNVLSSGSSFTWASGTKTIDAGVTTDADATKLSVQLFNSAGTMVDTKTFANQPAGTVSFQWTGKDSNGVAYGGDADKYTMKVTAMGDATVNSTLLTTSTVTGVTQGTAGVMARLASGTSVSTSDIKGVFKP